MVVKYGFPGRRNSMLNDSEVELEGQLDCSAQSDNQVNWERGEMTLGNRKGHIVVPSWLTKEFGFFLETG